MSSDNDGLSKPLSNPDNAVVDIVFVHGLQGHREKTWTKYNTFWPKTLLPTSVPKARIFTWGYDSMIAHFWTKASHSPINGHSSKLLADLAVIRETTETLDRPIIFVVHSMAGIVCANALVNSQTNAEPHVRRIVTCVRGLLFLGTPHAGSSKAKWAELGRRFLALFKDTNKDVTQILAEDSVKLADLGEAFPNFLRLRGEASGSAEQGGKIEVVCFFEEYPSSIGEVVPRESASLSGYESLPIPADHSDMCKFASASESGFISVSGTLARWITILSSGPGSGASEAGTTVTQHGSKFDSNYGGIQIGNSYSAAGGASVFGGSLPVFGKQDFHFGESSAKQKEEEK